MRFGLSAEPTALVQTIYTEVLLFVAILCLHGLESKL